MKTGNEEPLFVISASQAQTILNYLLRCPAGEVWTMVEGLRSLPLAKLATPPTAATDPTPGAGASFASEGT